MSERVIRRTITDDPDTVIVDDHDEQDHPVERSNSGIGLAIAVIAIMLLLLLAFGGRNMFGGNSDVNVPNNTQAPTVNQ